MYYISFDFETQDEPPQVFIVDKNGRQYLEIFEDPKPLTDEWSWNSEDWEPGPFARRVLNLFGIEKQLEELSESMFEMTNEEILNIVLDIMGIEE